MASGNRADSEEHGHQYIEIAGRYTDGFKALVAAEGG